MKRLIAAPSINTILLPKWADGLEWHIKPNPNMGTTTLPKQTLFAHVGDLREPRVGQVTELLERRLQALRELLQNNSQISGVVIHADSALGWEDGEQKARRRFWQLLAKTLNGVEVFVENNVLFNPRPRYDFIRDPVVLANELGDTGLRVALDISHAAWFYQGWPSKIRELLIDPNRVGHLHFSDWRPERHHMIPGRGVLPVRQIIAHYKGNQLTFELRRGIRSLWWFLTGGLF